MIKNLSDMDPVGGTDPASRKLLSIERHQHILDYLKTHKSVDVSNLSALLMVSEVTVRKDLERLERDGLLTRSHGGAVLNKRLLLEPSFAEKEDLFLAEKLAIAKAAAQMITDGMTAAIMTGTTLSHMAKLLMGRKQLNIVTNALNIAAELMSAEGINVFLTGGSIRPNTFALVGEMADRSLDGIYVETAFIGVNGLSIEHGLTTPSIEEARVVKKVLDNARTIVVAADHTKFGHVAFSRICSVEQVHTIITDRMTPTVQIDQLREKGIAVIIT
jgi:DeoR/GlpR family transcriptional regulator of sugar metabolism